MATNVVRSHPGDSTSSSTDQQTTHASNVTTQEYSVRIPKTKKRYHALKFHIPEFDMTTWSKGEMVRDASNQYVPRQDWETQPKSGQGSEYNKEAKEIARRKKFGYMPKKISPDDMPWIVTLKGNEKEKNKEKHYMGKKMKSENSVFYIFAKCPDGGFEAHPLEDWYTFTAHKAYKTLNIEEAEEEYKRRHKILNKYLIMANKRKNEGEEDEDGEAGVVQKGGTKTFSFSTTSKSVKTGGDDDDDSDGGKGKKKKNYKSSNLSDDDEEEETAVSRQPKKEKKGKAAKNSDDEEEIKTKEDSDDGDAEGLEKDYSSTGESDLESDHEKDEKYEEKGIDEEEPIKALDKSDESESEEDEGLTEEGKEYRKLMSKDGEKKEDENDEFNEFFRTGKTTIKKDDEDSKDSNLSSGISEFDEDGEVKKSSNGSKLKRKATDDLGPKGLKKTNKNSASAPNMASNVMTHDESSSSSSTSATPGSKAQQSGALLSTASKSSKTAAVIAAAEAAKQQSANSSGSKSSAITTHAPSSSQASSSSLASNSSSNSIISEEEVRRYLSRKPMTTKELLQKFRGKTQNTLTKEQLLESLRIILDKLHPKMIEKNGVKYLSLS